MMISSKVTSTDDLLQVEDWNPYNVKTVIVPVEGTSGL